MSRSPIDFIEHICVECDFVEKHIQGISEDDFSKSEVLKRAMARSIEIIGEASKNIPNDFKDKYPDIEWKKISGMRDVIIHQYFGVEYDIVWEVIKEKLPVLNQKLKAIILQ